MAFDPKKQGTGKDRPGTKAGKKARSAPTSENIRFADEEDGNIYAQSVDAGHRIDPRAQKIFVTFVVLLVVFAFGLICPKDLLNQALHSSGYNSGYTLSWFVSSLQENVNGIVGVFSGNDTGAKSYTSEILRYVVIMIAGAGLALCGAVYQGSFRNALVSPSTLGVMSGSTLGMMVWIVFFVADDGSNVAFLSSMSGVSGVSAAQGVDPVSDLLSTYALSLFSFAGCFLVVGLVLLAMRLMKSNGSGFMIIIVGQVIGGVAGAIVSTVRYYYVTLDAYGLKASLITNLQIATFYRNYALADIVAIAIPLIICFALVMRYRQKMMVLAFGSEEARTMGVETRKMCFVVVGLCTLLTAIIVSFCGHVGFVGFLIPHLARRIVGPNFKYLLPAATVIGAVFVLTAYVLVSVLLGPDYETMSGMYISIGGAIVFLVTALRGRGGAARGN